MIEKIIRFFHKIKMDLLRLAIYAVMLFVAVLAVCLVFSLPEIIGRLICG